MPREWTASRAAVIDERIFDAERFNVAAVFSGMGAGIAWVGPAVWQVLKRRPWDWIGATVAATATAGIFVNALFMQASPHPAPILPGKARPVAESIGSAAAEQKRPSPGTRETNAVDASTTGRPRTQVISDIQRELARRGFFDGPIDGVYGARTDAAIREFEQAAGLKASAQPDEALLRTMTRSAVSAPTASGRRPATAARIAGPAKPAPPSRRVLAVQRALADFGYGQVKPSGVFSAETKSAIERFERERKLPVTGQISDRLVRELAAVTGRSLE